MRAQLWVCLICVMSTYSYGAVQIWVCLELAEHLVCAPFRRKNLCCASFFARVVGELGATSPSRCPRGHAANASSGVLPILDEKMHC